MRKIGQSTKKRSPFIDEISTISALEMWGSQGNRDRFAPKGYPNRLFRIGFIFGEILDRFSGRKV